MSDNVGLSRETPVPLRGLPWLTWLIPSKALRVLGLGLAMVVALVLLARTGPPIWWDEGWTLSVARNWVEHGHYGRYLNGQLAPAGLEAAFPTVASVALSFRLLGIGIWQARLPILLYAGGALGLLAYLAYWMYGRSVAIATLLIAVLLPAHPGLGALYLGKQVLAEMPMLFFLLAGYACFQAALKRTLWYLPLAAVVWAIALMTKAQVYPFWIASLLSGGLFALVRQRWRQGLAVGIAFGSTLLISSQLGAVQAWLLADAMQPGRGVVGLYEITALVLVPEVRSLALSITLLFGLPTAFGLGYGALQWAKDSATARSHPDVALLRSMFLVLTGSWFAWFLLLSVGWTRYFMPPIFLGGVFVALLLQAVTDQFNVPATVARLVADFRRFRLRRQTIGTLVVFLLLVCQFPFVITTLQLTYSTSPDANAAEAVVNYLHTHTQSDALIETYDSELHFLLQRPYHYPPDQLHVELNRRTFLGQNVAIDYDPLAADPAYLVVGPYSRMWKLYEPILATDGFRAVVSYGAYDIYVRTNATLQR